MNILILVICLLSMVAGISKGICDSIVFHNGYKHLGPLWDLESWKIKYNPVTNLQKFFAYNFDVAINAWHVFDWLRTASFMLNVFCAYYCPTLLWFEWLSLIGFQIFFYLVFFKLFYR